MGPLLIEICNERLLPRFGVDRLLVLLARQLAKAGHEIGFVCLRCDKEMLLPISPDVTVLPVPEGLNMEGTEAAATAAMLQRWQQRRPDAVVVGGWPFFELAARAGAYDVASIFMDAGAVAQDGLPEPQLTIQRELRRIRQLTLPLIDRVLPISDFIRRTQSEPDRGNDTGVKTVLLGADHMALGTFGGDQQTGDSRDLVQRLERKTGRGEQLLIALGRFEAHGYKNSPAIYDVFRMVLERAPSTRLLLLDAGQDCEVPADLTPLVELLGAPDDLTLQEIMRLCAAGISTSLWEGFNLPIAEMQWLGRPAVAFSLGAHPEVVAEPWLLCDDTKEMATKIVALLKGDGSPELHARFAEFRERRQWEFTLSAWESEICDAVQGRAAAVVTARNESPGRRIILVDVTNASLDPANPGVIRVVRRLCAELQQNPDFELVFAAWDLQSEDYTFLNETRRKFLEGYSGPTDGLSLLSSGGRNLTPAELIRAINVGRTRQSILFTPEVLLDGGALARTKWAKRHGFKFAAILHDIIPIYRPEFSDPKINEVFPGYLEAILRADAVWSNSRTTQDAFNGYAASIGRVMPPENGAVWLPGQFGEQPRRTGPAANAGPEIRVLCVSTLEPRKNHLRLLEAFGKLSARRPDLRLRLVLIGNSYAGAPEIAEQVRAAAKLNASIEWLGTIDDARLAAEFENCTFTVYPSLVEGFGLPIVESLWMGRPCLAHNDGVMQELAVPGGCLTTDMTDPESIMRSLERLVTDEALLERLREQARGRKITTWRDYADEIAGRLSVL